ncbi:hypothetical protein Tco_0344710 [Tanacetum coccineum]
MNDVLYWHNNPGGLFSCRSAYLLALEADEDMVRTTIYDDLIDFWHVVWKARVPSKLNLLGLWTRRNKRFHGQLNGREGNVEAIAKLLLSEHHMANQREIITGTSMLHNTYTVLTRKRCKWENDNYICHGHILNGMLDALFDVYQNVGPVKELWDQLESKYMAEDSSSKKFLFTQHGLNMDESISVSSIIDKLPPSWKDFKHSLKHNKDELSLVQLGSHFRIEETLQAEESGKGNGKEIDGSSSVNMIEDGPLQKKINVLKRTIVETLLVRDKDLRILIHHKDDVFAWWIDSGATYHACKDHCWFDTFHPVQDGFVLHMGDESTKPILKRGNVVLEFNFGKTITLVNVVYVSGLRKNLMSGLVLNKCGYKQVHESDNYILSRRGVFVGFGYYNNGMFMLNLNKVPKAFSSVYMISSKDLDSSMWHARLGHIYYKRMLAMSKDN